jgi:glucokinase
MTYLIGIDLGGTNVVCGLLDAEGNVLRQAKRPTEAERGHEDIVRRIAGMAKGLMSEHGIDSRQVLAVGMGTPGRVNPELGVSVSSANLGWKNVPVAALLREQLGCPAFIDNDVRMYVYGEAMRGAGASYRHVLGVTVGTGIASAFVSDGRLHYGRAFSAGEIGHIAMDGLIHRCNCGKTGCLETLVSAPGIARKAREAIQSGRSSVLQQAFPDLDKLTAADVSRAYDQGDAVAIETMETVGLYLAKALAFNITALGPDVVIVGGGAALAGERLLAPVKRLLEELLPNVYRGKVQVHTAKWNEEAGMIGSALFAKLSVGGEGPRSS